VLISCEMCTNAGQFGQAIGQASEGEVRRGHQPGITCRYVSMYMGARNAQVDVIIAHTSASIVRMDTRTVYVGPDFCSNIGRAFWTCGIIICLPILIVCCCTSLSPTVSLAGFWTIMQQLANHMMAPDFAMTPSYGWQAVAFLSKKQLG